MLERKTKIGGVYEVGVGAREAEPLIKYFERFGYRIGQRGELSASEAKKLYGVPSKLKSIRLRHQESDHGLVRVMVWDEPVNEGLNLSNMKVLGNRWGAMLTADIYNLQNHVEEAIDQNLPLFYVAPQRAEIYKLEKRPAPFLENYAALREMCLIQPLTRQIVFQRFGYDVPHYGKINQDSFFKSSQITHFGMLVRDERAHLNFYDQVLGLLRTRDGDGFDHTDEDASAKAIFSLEKGDAYASTDFDHPLSSADPQKALSGRLKIIRFSKESKLEDRFDYAKPGSLGYSLYTLRVRGIEDYYRKIKASKATALTEILPNEFGERSFSFTAPDGYFWTLLED